MKPRKLAEASDPEAEVRATVVLEFRALLTGTVEELGRVAESFDGDVKLLYETCRMRSVNIVSGGGGMRPATQEEILAVVPRKWHLLKAGRQACETPHVSRKYLTEERESVTCKLCLRKMEEGA